MKLRRDTVFISSVLFTIALVWVIPGCIAIVLAGRDAAHQEDFGLALYLRQTAALGYASLAIILIGLIVTWGGYIQKVRWAWFVMFVIVLGWAFPVMAFPNFVYPLYSGALQITSFSGFIGAAFGQPGLVRSIVHEIVIFTVMVIALLLPIRSFFWGRER